MNPNEFPTKGNLILAKNSLKLAKQGYELMDKKQNILVKELMELIDKASSIQSEIDTTFRSAYAALQEANIKMGIRNVSDMSHAIPLDNSIRIKTRSIMGAEIPLVTGGKEMKPAYAYYSANESLDVAREEFDKVKRLTLELAGVENSAYRLASSINKTRKRANALKNITIPHFTELSASIANALEEKEREEFTRLKVIKSRKG